MLVHPSHKTRTSDASSYDEICTVCGYTDIGGGAGDLSYPCPGPPVPAKPLPPRKVKLALDWTRRGAPDDSGAWWLRASVHGLILHAAPARDGTGTFRWSMYEDDGDATDSKTDVSATGCKTIEDAQEDAEHAAATRLIEAGRRIHKVHERV